LFSTITDLYRLSVSNRYLRVQSKSNKEDIQLNIRRDGVFFYSLNKEWTNCVTQGRWKKEGRKKIVLNSDFQLSNYEVEELVISDQKGKSVVIQSNVKGQSPTTISKIFINEDETAFFVLDGETGLAMLEKKQKILVALSGARRDSLENMDDKRFYVFFGKQEIKTITMIFDLKEITYTVQNPQANKFIINTAFSRNAAYHYMKDVEYIFDHKFIQESGRNIKLKKQKR
jgi:hypothetical protein